MSPIDAFFYALAICAVLFMVIHWIGWGRENSRRGKEASRWLDRRNP